MDDGAPRLFGIPASRAPVVAVLRRGPSDWFHLGRWDVARTAYEPGAWLHGTVYPQRCDLSPDGRWFCYFALHVRARWALGGTYLAVSRLPWLSALAAWRTCGTWTRGLHFVERRRTWDPGEPDAGDAAPCRRRFGLAGTRPATFAVERRRGWTEAPDSPPRAADDVWDARRADAVRMEKPRPGTDGTVRLTVRGYWAAFRSTLPGQPHDAEYAVTAGDRVTPLAGVQWADWAGDGRLLVATRDGRLQIRAGADDVRWEADLSRLAPDPTPPPAEARRW